jgi:hypothetical protein
MKRIARIALMGALGLALGWIMAAQAPKPPVIPPDMKAKFWKAQAELLVAEQAAQQAAQAAQQKQVAAQTIQLEIQDKVCGKKFDLKPDANNDVSCVEKPEK